jgi:hypothetical protein
MDNYLDLTGTGTPNPNANMALAQQTLNCGSRSMATILRDFIMAFAVAIKKINKNPPK